MKNINDIFHDIILYINDRQPIKNIIFCFLIVVGFLLVKTNHAFFTKNNLLASQKPYIDSH